MLCGEFMSWVILIKNLLVCEHRASHFEESVSDAAQRPCVAVAPGTQSGVFVFADWVMLDRDPSPVVDGVLQTMIDGTTAHHTMHFAGPSCHVTLPLHGFRIAVCFAGSLAQRFCIRK